MVGSGLAVVLLLAISSSSLASVLTCLAPTARSMLAMAVYRALPQPFARGNTEELSLHPPILGKRHPGAGPPSRCYPTTSVGTRVKVSKQLQLSGNGGRAPVARAIYWLHTKRWSSRPNRPPQAPPQTPNAGPGSQQYAPA